ncbi:pyridoxine 5'-phosphate synthase [Syntrophus gentianae]|uniref:pyridoxine 5'-phosphate synthase n=1 Tax=Syntrophus gentianae TaxID=43775 RepID=UPI001113CA0B|nr:pyridoxine 5'-phosphate synthase [Syntrophus gentianae]
MEKIELQRAAGLVYGWANDSGRLNVVGLPEVNIGHAILSRAVSVGLSRAVDEMLVILE